MNDSTFTAGPWEIGHRWFVRQSTGILGDDGEPLYRLIATVCDDGNVPLIAASPTMYSFIKRKADEGDKDASTIIQSIGVE